MSDANDVWGVETWRGSVGAWQCDEMGHQNARFYVAQAMEGMAEFWASLNISSLCSTDRIFITEHVVRFLQELRVGTPIHLQSALVGYDESTAIVAQSLQNSISGNCAATMLAQYRYEDRNTGKPRPWPEEFTRQAHLLVKEIPQECGPKGLASSASSQRPSLALADELNLITTGRGVITDKECDASGRFLTEGFTARFSDATRLFTARIHEVVANAFTEPCEVGSASVETRETYFAYPRVGSRFVVRSAIAVLGEKTRRLEYWMLDPATGEPWARLESVELLLDLTRRKTLNLPPGASSALAGLVRSFD